MQFPTGFMVILFLSVLLNGEHIDQLLTEKLRTKKTIEKLNRKTDMNDFFHIQSRVVDG